MQRALSNAQYSILLKECQLLVGTRMDKAYEVEPKKLRLDFGKLSLIIYLGKYFFLTSNPPPAPEKPSSFAMFLRKHIGGKFLISFSQHENDRLYKMNFSNGLTLVFEQFAQGNAFLLDLEGKILYPYSFAPTSAKKYKVGEQFAWPVQKNLNWKEKGGEEGKPDLGGASSYSEYIEKLVMQEEQNANLPKENPQIKKLEHRLAEQEKNLLKLDKEIEEHSKIANWMEQNLSLLDEKIENARKNKEKKIKIEID